jgi:SAM-dependent methyltransferase
MDEATRESLRIWDGVAPGWEKNRDRVNELESYVTDQMFDAIGAREGDTILELTAGSGGAGLQLAARRPDVNMLVTDFAPAMVGAIKSAVSRLGLKNVETRLIDAQAIELPDASVDGVISRHGLMLVPDYRKAFREIRRVLKPGRVLSYIVWSPLVENPWMMLVGATLMQQGHFTPPPGGGFFPLTTPEENSEVLKGAGYDAVTTRVVKTPMIYPSFEDYWRITTEIAGPMVEIVARLSDAERTAARDAIEQYTEPFRAGKGLEFPSSRILVRAS